MNELQITNQESLITFANDFIVKNAIIPSKNYNVTNAMVALYTNVLTVKDKNGKMALETCTPASIQNAIYECITRELTPSKKQAYFIPYGNELQLQTSYFGNQKIARDVAGVVINSMVVHEGDQIDAEVRANGSMIIKHKPNILCLNKPIIMAYAVACNEITGEIINSDIMTIEEIRKSWAKSRGGSVSKEFPHEMARRTVTNRLAKHIINTSDDSKEIYVTDIDGKRIKVNQYEDLPTEENFDYTINTDANETYIPESKSENVVTASDLKLENTAVESEKVEVPEGAFEIKYSEYKNNTDKYEMVQGTWNAETRTVMVTNKE